MASSDEPEQDIISLEERLQEFVASLGNEALGEVLREIGRGKELDVARTMIERVSKK